MNNFPQVKFVPYLHNNSTTLKSSNLILMACNRNTSQLLEKSLLSSNLVASMKLIKTTSVAKGDSLNENKTLFSSNFDVTEGSKFRDSWFEKLVKNRMKNMDDSIESDKCNVSIFPKSFNRQDNPNNYFLKFIGDKEYRKHYSSVLLQNDAFVDFAKASTHQPCVKKWLEDIILGENESYFDTLCQSINKKLLKFVIETGKERQAKKTDKGKVTFH